MPSAIHCILSFYSLIVKLSATLSNRKLVYIAA